MIAVKAQTGSDGSWELDVLGNPFGGPHAGKDAHGEFFSRRTNFREDRHGLPPPVYYHGFEPSTGRPMGMPEYIGTTVARWVDAAGVWYRVVLDQGSRFAQKVWAAALRSAAFASSGSAEHLRRVDLATGEILHWPVVELSIWDLDARAGAAPANWYAVALPVMKARYAHMEGAMARDDGRGDETIEDVIGEAVREAVKAGQEAAPKPPSRETIKGMIDSALAEERRNRAEAEDAQRKRQEEIEAAVKAAQDALRVEYDQKLLALRRLPGGGGIVTGQPPYAAKFAELWPYDNLDAGDMALMVAVLRDAKRRGLSEYGATPAACKALAVKLAEGKDTVAHDGQQAMKLAGLPIKTNEIMQSDLTSYGDEWVGAAYSQMLWEKIRVATFVADMLRSIEIPQGMESVTIPVEGIGFTFYKVGDAATLGSSGWPDATITSSRQTTDRKALTAKKMGARALWTGELEEDSLIPFVPFLRESLQTDGSEHLESLLIDGDTDLTATTNINLISGTPGGTEYYTILDGFRKLALITNTANARDAGALDDADFLETVKLLGTSGINALDRSKVCFIIDPNVNWKMLALASVKTRDVNSQATIEAGNLTRIYGYDVKVSAQMHKQSAKRMANTAGKVNGTDSSNTTGAILAVRHDQWVLGYKRRMKLEVTRIPRADANEIVATMRLDMVNRDTEAASISYNVTV